MLFVILIYNFMMFGFDVIALMLVSTQRTWLWCSITIGGHLAAAFCVAVLLAGPSFAGLNLLTYGLFVHLPLVLFCTGVFFFRRRRFLSATAFIVGFFVVAIAVDALLVEPRWLEVSHHQIFTSKLSRPHRIAIIADLQTDQLTDYERTVFETMASESPDMVLFAGDYLQAGQDDWFELAEKYGEFFQQIGLSAPLGVYAVGGNADHPRWQDIFADVPVTASRNTQVSTTDPFQVTQLSVADSFDTKLRIPAPTHFTLL